MNNHIVQYLECLLDRINQSNGTRDLNDQIRFLFRRPLISEIRLAVSQLRQNVS